MSTVFNVNFEFEQKEYEASVAVIQPVGDAEFHVNIKDPGLIERYQNNFIFTDKDGTLTYPSDPAGFMNAIATAIDHYVAENKIEPDTTAGFYETS